MKKAAILLVLALSMSLMMSCGSSSDYKVALLNFEGYDFSENMRTTNPSLSDGEVTNYAPPPTISSKSFGDFLWFSPRANTEEENFIKHYGDVTLSSVVEVPTVWDAGPGQQLEPLVFDHVYVARCLDGYVKFRVLRLGDRVTREVEVEYWFTSSTTFDK